MIRRWINVLLTALVVAGLGGLAGCHKKKQVTGTQQQSAVPAGEQPSMEQATPQPTGPVTFPKGEEPVIMPGADITGNNEGLGFWQTEYTVDFDPQHVVDYFRQEAGKRGWQEQSFHPLGVGATVMWETPHGELQLVAGKRRGGGTTVYLTWNEKQ